MANATTFSSNATVAGTLAAGNISDVESSIYKHINITSNDSDIVSNTTNISGNATEILTNAADIATLQNSVVTSDANENVYAGFATLANLTDGVGNTARRSSLNQNTTGNYNTAVGEMHNLTQVAIMLL